MLARRGISAKEIKIPKSLVVERWYLVVPNALGKLHNLIAHSADHPVDRDAGLCHFPEKNPGKETIGIFVFVSKSIKCLLTGARRKNHHLSRSCCGGSKTPATDRSALRSEGIIPTRINDRQAEPRLPLTEVIQNLLQWYCFIFEALLNFVWVTGHEG